MQTSNTDSKKRKHENEEFEMKQRTYWTETTITTLSISSDIFEMPKSLYQGSGLYAVKKLLVYRRPEFITQIDFLRNEVVNHGKIGWIVGAPGIGKSTTTFALVCSLIDKFNCITWIHLRRDFSPQCIKFKGDTKYMTVLPSKEVKSALYEDTNHFVVLDGYIPEFHSILVDCNNWYEENQKSHRLCIVSSMFSRLIIDLSTEFHIPTVSHVVHSWTIEDYQNAYQDTEFQNNFGDLLDGNDTVDDPSIADRIISKEYFAGGSCLFMFCLTIEWVIEFLNESIGSAGKVMDCIQSINIGNCSGDEITRLFGKYRDGPSTISFSSRFVATQFAIREGPLMIQNLESLHGKLDPCMMMEMQFFSFLTHGGVDLRNVETQERIIFPGIHKFELITFDPKHLGKTKEICEGCCIWLKPMKFNQGGYDAVFLNHKGDKFNEITFIQLARRPTHSYNEKYFGALLSKLAEIMGIDVVHIYFLGTKEGLEDTLKSFKTLSPRPKNFAAFTFDSLGCMESKDKNQKYKV